MRRRTPHRSDYMPRCRPSIPDTGCPKAHSGAGPPECQINAGEQRGEEGGESNGVPYILPPEIG